MRDAKRRSIHPTMSRRALALNGCVPAHAIIISPRVLVYHANMPSPVPPLRPTPVALTAPGRRRRGACPSRDLVADGGEAHLDDVLVRKREPRTGAQVVDAEGGPRGVGERVPPGQG